MQYWKGNMNWDLDKNWTCEICKSESHGLTWGMRHAECGCDNCGAVYTMRDWKNEEKVVTKPILVIKKSWIKPCQDGWMKYKRSIDELVEEGLIIEEKS